jgi:glycosyltransferase involved in cell wall biosynthesis
VFGARLVIERLSRPASVVWYRHWHEVFLRRALRRHLATLDDCVVYAQGPLDARAALQARRGPHQRVVMAVHMRVSQADEWAHKRQIELGGAVFRSIRRAEREVVPRVDGLVFVSRWAREALLAWLPEAEAVPSTVIFNFVAPFQGEPVVDESPADLVTVGVLEPTKNHRYLLDVLAQAKHAGRAVTLDIFGEGPLRGDLERQIVSLGLGEQVRLRGFRPDVCSFLPGYRAYAHASYSESSSLTIIESMSAGLPILAGNIGPISELFDDGVEGRFWPLDDPARAAATLVDFLDREPERRRAGDAARSRFRRDFDAEQVAPRLEAFLMGTAPEAQPYETVGASASP